MNDSDFSLALSHAQTRSNQHLNVWLNRLETKDASLVDVMKHGALLGGKRIRPFLTYSTGALFNVSEDMLDTPATAVECIHAYSLIHDDLPAMDNDDLRRGQPTCHIAFDHASAILAGDALQTLGFSVLAEGVLDEKAEKFRIKMIQELAKASGANGMCLGQALDLAYEGKSISIDELENIHRNKTGALIRCAVRLGALAAGEEGEKYLNQLDAFADAIGLAFQVQDDILDIIGDTQTLGKPQGSDLALQKSTYPALLGLEGAQQKAQHLYQEALLALESIPYNTKKLEQFARYIIERNC